MSKPVKNLIAQSYQKRFGSLDGAVLIDIRGIKSNQANKLRGSLATKKIRITVVKNSLAKRALAGTPMAKAGDLLEGPTAIVYGGDSVVSVARELIAALKDLETLKFRGAVMEGQVYSADQIAELSKYPTRAEAQATTVTLFLTPGRKLAGQIVAPGRKIASLIKAIQEKKEKEAAPAAVAAAPTAA